LGTEFAFEFDGLSLLLYGPNGSGKSSLLNAIVWVLTGQVVTDGDAANETLTLYTPPKSAGASPSKLGEWPVVGTLPNTVAGVAAGSKCWVEVDLRSTDGRRLLLRRSYPNTLRSSQDGSKWEDVTTLAAHGISPLDIQLSVTAATLFGRENLEAAESTRYLLSSMLGYEALEDLGVLLTSLGTNLTKAIKGEKETEQKTLSGVRAALAAQSSRVRDGHPLRVQLDALAADIQPTEAKIGAVRDDFIVAKEKAESELATLLGIPIKDSSPQIGLADALTTSVAHLSKPWRDIFQTIAAIVPVPVPGVAGASGQHQVQILASDLATFEKNTTQLIRERLDWWRRESAAGSNATLLIQAARSYNPTAASCPVCEQDIADQAVAGELTRLKEAPTHLLCDLKAFFRNLADELRTVVPEPVRGLARTTPVERITADWQRLRTAIGPIFNGIVAPYDTRIAAWLTQLSSPHSGEDDLLPVDTEQEFRAAATEFLGVLSQSRRGVATLAWGVERLGTIEHYLTVTLLSSGTEGNEPSLRMRLEVGKHAAADIMPLGSVVSELRHAADSAGKVQLARDQAAAYEEVKTGIEQIKPLGKYAEAEVERVFDAIRDRTLVNFRRLYPRANPNLTLTRLHLHKGRDRSVEPRLAIGGYEVPGQHVANAGMQRAVALAFFFALLDNHPGGLGFVVMDDPILSLDDDHREAWSANILRPVIAVKQMVVATHQREFLNNCRTDFHLGRLVELNPRHATDQITYRSGDRLARAEKLVETAYTSAPNEMRKFREEVLSTLSAYSPTPFFSTKDFAGSLELYEAIIAPHPLAHENQKKIVTRLREPRVVRVLDAGSHAPTEAAVSCAMVQACLDALRDVSKAFQHEIERLDGLRLWEIRGRSIGSTSPIATDNILRGTDAGAPATIPSDILRVGQGTKQWDDPVELTLIGYAAAKSRGCVVTLAEDPEQLSLPPGVAVLIASDVLSPTLPVGGWALLGDEVAAIRDGDLVAAIDQADCKYLRRVWSVGEKWVLTADNTISGIQPAILRKCASSLRKIVGVLYQPTRIPSPTKRSDPREWQPHGGLPLSDFARYSGIGIEGSSLVPLALHGQTLLVGPPITSTGEVGSGRLLVVETQDDAVGNVVKFVYPQDKVWVLTSPNPLEPREPITVATDEVRSARPVIGVLFEVAKE
jgi:energy-coupling factor transporter ATP-binding protein EcfA2